MGDRNIVQFKKRVWHYWNWGSMMPICGAGQPDTHWFRSMHRTSPDYRRVKNICPDCLEIEARESVKKAKT